MTALAVVATAMAAWPAGASDSGWTDDDSYGSSGCRLSGVATSCSAHSEGTDYSMFDVGASIDSGAGGRLVSTSGYAFGSAFLRNTVDVATGDPLRVDVTIHVDAATVAATTDAVSGGPQASNTVYMWAAPVGGDFDHEAVLHVSAPGDYVLSTVVDARPDAGTIEINVAIGALVQLHPDTVYDWQQKHLCQDEIPATCTTPDAVMFMQIPTNGTATADVRGKITSTDVVALP